MYGLDSNDVGSDSFGCSSLFTVALLANWNKFREDKGRSPGMMIPPRSTYGR